MYTPLCLEEIEPLFNFSPEYDGLSENKEVIIKKRETSEITIENFISLDGELGSVNLIDQSTPQELEGSKKKKRKVRHPKSEDDESDIHSRLRWGKKEDIPLFKEIYRLEKEKILSLSDFSNKDPDLGDSIYDGLALLAKNLNWKLSLKKFYVRISKRISNEFSVREILQLKKMMKCTQYSNIDYEEILYSFPGKPMETIKAA